ncbi:SIMPL domain-containing protein [Fastidiosipila sanguinis]|uniref:SIMPL domain-containing protein n=1 Tax=Fastidiosipila sanguinis TaxID=236753 RepID=A0A2S0KPB2_9FIRM|nr:SIMPL domain-containing protein [Fastidiosipila sanguinis]AVM42863.1 hypothetical protein C5Q98_06395 [Fastidiosipila sanguinis]
MDKVLKVEASGIGKIKPNQIEINIVISRKSEIYEDAINLINQDLDRMLQALNEIGIERKQTKTTSLRVSNDYENYEENGVWKNKHVGYITTHQLKVKIDYNLDLLGDFMYKFSGLGINPEIDFDFTVKDKSEAIDTAIDNAIESAKVKAEKIAKSTGVKLGEIVAINYVGSNFAETNGTFYSADLMRGALNAKSSPDILVDEIVVTETVEISWSIE